MVQFAILLLVSTPLLTGPIDVWIGSWPIDVFGWFALPSPFATMLEAWPNPIGDDYRYSGYLVAVQIAAALKHLLIDRDAAVH